MSPLLLVGLSMLVALALHRQNGSERRNLQKCTHSLMWCYQNATSPCLCRKSTSSLAERLQYAASHMLKIWHARDSLFTMQLHMHMPHVIPYLTLTIIRDWITCASSFVLTETSWCELSAESVYMSKSQTHAAVHAFKQALICCYLAGRL